MRQRSTLCETIFIKRQVQRWILNVELCVSGSDFTRLDAEQLLVKLNALLNVVNVQRKVRFQGLYLFLAGHLLSPFHIRLRECAPVSARSPIYVKPYMQFRGKIARMSKRSKEFDKESFFRAL